MTRSKAMACPHQLVLSFAPPLSLSLSPSPPSLSCLSLPPFPSLSLNLTPSALPGDLIPPSTRHNFSHWGEGPAHRARDVQANSPNSRQTHPTPDQLGHSARPHPTPSQLTARAPIPTNSPSSDQQRPTQDKLGDIMARAATSKHTGWARAQDAQPRTSSTHSRCTHPTQDELAYRKTNSQTQDERD